MKNKLIVINICLLVFTNTLFSQNINEWTVNSANQKFFIENKGQFDERTWQKNVEVEFAIDNSSGFDILFSENGLSFRFDKIIKESEKKSENEKVNFTELINVNWIDANKNVEIIAEEMAENYFSYAIRKPFSKEVYNINHINGYKKLIYKNLYDNIDVVYELFDKGLKYKLLVHPGGDVSKVKLKYIKRNTNRESNLINNYIDNDGNYTIKTSIGEIKELKPYSFYKNSEVEVKSNFKLENNILSFDINYDHSQELIIDPWIVSTTFNNSTAVWEVETDSIGNVYVIGGESPMKLQKYNSIGTLQWTYTTPWDTASVWLGTLKTDNNGTSYITSGTAPEIERINSSAGMVWHSNGSGFSDEYWAITFNCDKSKLFVGGTILNMFAFNAYATIFEIDINNGNVLSSQKIDSASISGMGATPIEVRSLASSNNGKHIFLTHNDIGVINENSTLLFKVNNGHNYSYKCENYMPASQFGAGIKALTANDQYIYTHSGNQIHKRNLTNGTLITSVAISGGTNQTVLGKLVINNCGLAVDNCGNVFAGSGDRVIKYDPDLNFISEELLPFTVYDVSVNSNGEVIAVGAQGNNQVVNRNGKIQSVNLNACAQFNQICCNLNILPVDTFCLIDSLVNLTFIPSGGVWSGVGITDTINGIFNPSVAGPGPHYVYYTLLCGNDSTLLQVNICSFLTVCQESNGDVSVSGGTGPYTWEYYSPAISSPITNQTECEACGYIWTGFPLNQCNNGGIPVNSCNTLADWIFIANGSTITPGINFPVMVTDFYGNNLTINNIYSLPQCISSIKENVDGFSIKVIPNPSSADFTVTFNQIPSEKASLSLTDASGRVVFKASTCEKEYIIHGEILPAGLYLLKVESGKNIITEKLSKK